MPTETSAERVLKSLSHKSPDRVPLDFGSTTVTGIHVACVAALREYYGLEKGPVKVIDPGQMLGEVAEDLKQAIGIDTGGIFRRMTRFGFPADNWKPWRAFGGLEVLVPGGFNTAEDANGDLLMHPEGDAGVPACAKMPRDGYYFDAIIRQDAIDEDRLDPKDNLEEFSAISGIDLAYLEKEAKRAAKSGRAVVANFGGTAFGDIALVPGLALKHPKGIRDIAEWYMSILMRRDYVRAVFEGQCAVALANLEKIAARMGDMVNVVNICGTDFGTQTSSFCSVETFRDLWMPFYRRVNDWIHRNTRWKTFKHSCGAIEKFLESLIECGFDILNPVQCSASGMDPAQLKAKYGDRLVFWGGGIDTQKVLPFGSPQEVREQVLRRCEIFAKGGGFVFNAVHNIQAGAPVANIVAMIDAVHEFNGRR